MSGQDSKIKAAYFDKQNTILIGVPACLYFFPRIVKSVVFFESKAPLSDSFLVAVDEFMILLALFFLVAGVCQGIKGFLKRGLVALVGSGMWIFAARGIIRFADRMTVDHAILNLILCGVLSALLYGFFGARLIIGASCSEENISAGKLYKITLSKILWALVLGTLLQVVDVINAYLWDLLSGIGNSSFAGFLARAFIQVLVFYIILLPVVLKLKKASQKQEVAPNDEAPEKSKKVFPLAAIISVSVSLVVLFLFAFINNGMKETKASKLDAIYGELESYGILIAASGGADLYLEADGRLDDFYAEIYAWKGILDENENYIEVAKEHRDNANVEYLLNWYEAKNEKDISGFRNKVLSGKASGADIFAYLECLKGIKASAEDKAIRDDLFMGLILSEKYNEDYINPFAISSKEKKTLSESLDIYEMLADSFLEYKVAAATILEGGVNENVIELCYQLADTHPEDLVLQKMAFNACRQLGMHDYDYSNRSIGMKYLYAYDELFEELFEYDNGKESLTEYDYILEKLEMATYFIEMNLYDELIEYLTSALENVEADEFYDYLAFAYGELGNAEKALEFLEKIYITDMSSIDDVELLFRFGENYIRNRQYQKGIEAFGHMSEVILNMEEPGEYNTYLSSAISMLGNGDKRVDGTERSIYEYDFSDEDKEMLAKYEYLNMMVGLEFHYSIYSNIDVRIEEMSDEIPKLDDLFTKKYSNIAYSWYILGNYCYQIEWYEEAVEYYKKSLEVYDDQPYCWFSLATLYDYLGDYPNSRRAAEHVILLQHDNSHLNDPYGVTWHTNLLLEKLEKAGY